MVEGYTRATNTLGMETIATLSSAPGLETHHLNMSMIGIHGGQLERQRQLSVCSGRNNQQTLAVERPTNDRTHYHHLVFHQQAEHHPYSVASHMATSM